MPELGRRPKERLDELLGNAKKEAGQYDAAAGKATNAHLQGENPPPPRGPNKAATHGAAQARVLPARRRLKRNWKGDPKKLEKEFYEQLKGQEEGLNKLTVGEYLENRAKFEQVGRGSSAAQADLRSDLRKEVYESVKDSLAKRGIVGEEAKQLAASKTDEIMSTLAALHEPDGIAGGRNEVGGIGDRQVNSSIGSQPKDERKAGALPLDRKSDGQVSRRLC